MKKLLTYLKGLTTTAEIRNITRLSFLQISTILKVSKKKVFVFCYNLSNK